MERRVTLNSARVQRDALHPATKVGSVTIKVADLQRSEEFYVTVIGLRVLERNEGTVLLGAGGRPIVRLEHVPGAPPQPPETTGLYHMAILLPDGHALAVKASQLLSAHRPLGRADHLVSEALYLSDPDGIGIEIYRDRPRENWPQHGGQVEMSSEPLDMTSLLARLRANDPALADPAVPDDTRMGHMHLRVSDLTEGERFYRGVLGFDVTARVPGAVFLAAGGYHHHIALNVWQSQGGHPPAEHVAGMREFSILLPDRGELARVVARIEAAGLAVAHEQDDALVHDPAHNQIRLTAEESVAQR
ncbi:MAG: VOC family protein [Anaerolineae bacterium]